MLVTIESVPRAEIFEFDQQYRTVDVNIHAVQISKTL